MVVSGILLNVKAWNLGWFYSWFWIHSGKNLVFCIKEHLAFSKDIVDERYFFYFLQNSKLTSKLAISPIQFKKKL